MSNKGPSEKRREKLSNRVMKRRKNHTIRNKMETTCNDQSWRISSPFKIAKTNATGIFQATNCCTSGTTCSYMKMNVESRLNTLPVSRELKFKYTLLL